ncbi:MAG: cytochrome c, partial [Solirubrobacterales bacterium]|nr:cytochrome c [Solirubrobacterales bacterium]
LGATAGTLDRIEQETAPQYERGQLIVAESGCLACHAIGDAGVHGGLGPDLSDIGANVPREAIKQSVAIGPGIMPSFQGLGEENLNAVADYLASLQTEH